MPKFLLDTNACIIYLKFPNSKIQARLAAIEPTDIAVCSVVKFEMFYGSFRSSDPARSLSIQNKFLGKFKSFSFDDAACEAAARIRAELTFSGRMIGAYDLLIAAIALANDLRLVTHNTSEFSRVTGLRIEDWEI